MSTFQLHQQLAINRRGVSGGFKDMVLDPTDDLYCALGAFNIHLTASGIIKPVFSGPTSHESILRNLVTSFEILTTSTVLNYWVFGVMKVYQKNQSLGAM